MISAGIDAGSRAIKVVLFDSERRRSVTCGAVDQGVRQEQLAMGLLDHLLAASGLGRADLGGIVATGYGRKLIRVADRSVTEITCQGRGVRHVVPAARTIVDIGGQDSKLVRVNGHGAVEEFTMNDRCAAGTGRFLEVVATRLGMDLDAMGRLAAGCREAAIISSMCVVFAETEIVGLLASGTDAESIAAGVFNSLASRIAAMAGRKIIDPVVFTGGVALVPGMDHALATALNRAVTIAPNAQMTAALGAALAAADEAAACQDVGKRLR